MSEANPELMQRRELLRRAAWLLGGAISAPAALAFLQGCSRKEAEGTRAWTPEVLSAAELKTVAAISEIMIPKTDTSGALDAGVPRFIDGALAARFTRHLCHVLEDVRRLVL